MKTALRVCFLPPTTMLSMWHSHWSELCTLWSHFFFQGRKLKLRLNNLPQIIQLLNRRARIETQEIWPPVSSGDRGGVSWELANHWAPWSQCSVVQVAGYVESTQAWKCESYWMSSRDLAPCHVPWFLTMWHQEFKFWDLNNLSSASFPLPLDCYFPGTFLFLKFAKPISASRPSHLLTLCLELSSLKPSQRWLIFLKTECGCNFTKEPLWEPHHLMRIFCFKPSLSPYSLLFPSSHLCWSLIIFSVG